MEDEAKPPAEVAGAGPDNHYPDPLPGSYGELQAFLLLQKQGEFNPFPLRLATFNRIQAETKRPLLCYATQTSDVPKGAPVSIDDGDLRNLSTTLRQRRLGFTEQAVAS